MLLGKKSDAIEVLRRVYAINTRNLPEVVKFKNKTTEKYIMFVFKVISSPRPAAIREQWCNETI